MPLLLDKHSYCMYESYQFQRILPDQNEISSETLRADCLMPCSTSITTRNLAFEIAVGGLGRI